MTVESWLASAIADAEQRGLTPLTPLLEALARSTAALRAADRAHRESVLPAVQADDGKGSRR